MDAHGAGPEDLNVLGIEFPLPVDESGLAEMARCFAEEFARMGWTDGDILGLFRDPFYRGPHAVWQRRGESFVRAVLAEVRGMAGGSRAEPQGSGEG